MKVMIPGQPDAQRFLYVHCQPGGPDHCQVLNHMVGKKCACDPWFSDQLARAEYEKRLRAQEIAASPRQASLRESVGETSTPKSEVTERRPGAVGVQGPTKAAREKQKRPAAHSEVAVVDTAWSGTMVAEEGQTKGSGLFGMANREGGEKKRERGRGLLREPKRSRKAMESESSW